jgi:hypothetical protein
MSQKRQQPPSLVAQRVAHMRRRRHLEAVVAELRLAGRQVHAPLVRSSAATPPLGAPVPR